MAGAPKVEWPADKLITSIHHAKLAIERLLFQFQSTNQPTIQAVVESYACQVDILEQTFLELCTERWIPVAIGVQLDNIGSVVGEARAGRNDADYRVAIIGRITQNMANSRVEDILTLFVRLLPGFSFSLQEPPNTPPASVRLTIVEAVSPGLNLAPLDAELIRARGAGIASHLYFGFSAQSVRFKLAVGDVPVPSAIGLGDDTQTSGGVFSDIVS